MRIVYRPYDYIIVHEKEKQSSNIFLEDIGFTIQKIFVKSNTCRNLANFQLDVVVKQ